MIFKKSWAADPSRSGTVWFRSRMVLSCHINYQNFGELMFGRILTKKTDFHVQLLIGFIPSHRESPNFWHVISKFRTTLYWNHIVPDRQGSAAHEISNHWIPPILTLNGMLPQSVFGTSWKRIVNRPKSYGRFSQTSYKFRIISIFDRIQFRFVCFQRNDRTISKFNNCMHWLITYSQSEDRVLSAKWSHTFSHDSTFDRIFPISKDCFQ